VTTVCGGAAGREAVRLTDPNGVEMPNGSVVEMIDGQQLELVLGCLVEIRPATIALDDGEIC
jgi:hypothetical protein